MEKSEISLARLLIKCELRGRDNTRTYDWRLEKYVEAASALLLNLMKSGQNQAQERISEYTRRIDFLKKLVESQKVCSPNERMVAVQLLPRGVPTVTDNLTREIHLKTCSKYTSDLRAELFGSSKRGNEADTVRQRRDDKSTGEDLDGLLKQNQTVQEKATEEMLLLARTLKEQSQLAGQLIRRDIETISKSSNKSEDNKHKLKQASEILEEHNRRSGKCWLWIIQIIVIVVFFNSLAAIKEKLSNSSQGKTIYATTDDDDHEVKEKIQKRKRKENPKYGNQCKVSSSVDDGTSSSSDNASEVEEDAPEVLSDAAVSEHSVNTNPAAESTRPITSELYLHEPTCACHCGVNTCKIVAEILIILNELTAKVNSIYINSSTRGPSLIPAPARVSAGFPLRTVESLAEFDKSLQADVEKRETLKAELSAIGGSSATDEIYKVLKFVMSNETGTKFSFYGKRTGKAAFSETTLCKVIIDAVRANNPDFKVKAAEDSIKSWLRQAKQREQNELLKKARITL